MQKVPYLLGIGARVAERSLGRRAVALRRVFLRRCVAGPPRALEPGTNAIRGTSYELFMAAFACGVNHAVPYSEKAQSASL